MILVQQIFIDYMKANEKLKHILIKRDLQFSSHLMRKLILIKQQETHMHGSQTIYSEIIREVDQFARIRVIIRSHV